jgi:WD40 repeat protein
VNTISFSPDGRLVLSSSKDKMLRLWKSDTGELMSTLEGHTGSVNVCAFSPDGRLIFSTSDDKTVRVWDVAESNVLACLPMGVVTSLEWHPWIPQIGCGDNGGGVYQVKIVGNDYGPIIITAAETRHGIEARCPACQNRFQITRDKLDSKMTCPTESCGLELKINPFVIHTN